MERAMNNYAHPDVLVSTQWLADHLDDNSIRIVEVDMSPENHQNTHIPGAMFWSLMTDLLNHDFSQKLEINTLEALLSRSGITAETTVIAYGSYPGTGGWIFWLLKLLGHKDVRVLNGGHQKWMSEGRPVTSELANYASTQYSIAQLDPQLRIGYDKVLANLQSPEQVLVDVRTQAEYSGEQFLMQPPKEDERAGHIPDAVHLEQTLTLNTDGTIKSFDELTQLYSQHGGTADKLVVTYCAIGARAGYIWFVLKCLLGYPNVKNYDGSWNEWSRQPNAPVTQS